MKVYTKEILHSKILPYFSVEETTGDDWDGCFIGGQVPMGLDIVRDEVANRCGVDFICHRDGEILGYNTYYMALFTAIYRAGIYLNDKKVLILGDGHRARAAEALAKDMGAGEVVILSCGENGIWDLNAHHDTQVIFQCEIRGAGAPMPCEELYHFPYLVGVVECDSLPLRSRLLEEAEREDKLTVQGLYIQVAQVAIAASLMKNDNPSPTEIGNVNKDLQEQLANIVLVGMDGCGAEAVAELLSKRLSRPLVRVPNLSEAVSRAGYMTGAVLLVSEGVAAHKEYAYTLASNGRVYFFVRPLPQLEGNPLSGDALDARYRELLPGFRAFADQTHSYFGDPMVPLKEILADFSALPYKKRE